MKYFAVFQTYQNALLSAIKLKDDSNSNVISNIISAAIKSNNGFIYDYIITIAFDEMYIIFNSLDLSALKSACIMKTEFIKNNIIACNKNESFQSMTVISSNSFTIVV